jgi:hypothetical protein
LATIRHRGISWDKNLAVGEYSFRPAVLAVV